MTCGKDYCLQKRSRLLAVGGKERHLFVRRDVPRWLLVNEVGAMVIRLRNQRRSPVEIAEIIRKRYDCSHLEAQRDVASFCAEVDDKELLAEPARQRATLAELKLGSPELYVTTRCNHSCAHCSVRGAFPEMDMPRELFVEVVRQSAALGAWRIVITGGEPFLREDLLELLRSIERAVPVQILTNGTLIDTAKARELAVLGVAIQVSLDGGCKEVHDPIRGKGTFDAAVRAIRVLRDSRVSPLSINFTIQRANAEEIGGLIELAEREMVREVSLTPLVPGMKGKRRFQCADADSILTVKRYLDQYDGAVFTGLRVPGFGRDAICGQRWCTLGQSPSIVPDGSVFPCTPFACAPFLIGRIPKDTLQQVLASETVNDLRRTWEERAEQIEECSSCVWKHFCHGGCPAFAYHRHGTLLAKDCFCEVRKRLYTELFLGGQDNGDRCPE